jgi:type IV secretion system protein VirB4
MSASNPAAPRFWDQARKEASLADFVSVSAPVSEHDTITRAGDYLRTWRLEGVAFEAASPSDISDRHESLCSLLSNLPAGECAVYMHRLQRKVTDRLTDPVEPRFSAEFSKVYQDGLAAKPFLARELYITLLHRPFRSDMAKRFSRGGRTLDKIRAQKDAALQFMNDKGAVIERTLRAFDPSLLGVREEGADLYWQAGEFYSYLINGTWQSVRFPTGPAWRTLPNARLLFGGDKLEIRQGLKRRFVAMLDIKEYASTVQPGTLGALLFEDMEFVETQSFLSMPRRQATAALQIQRNQLIASDDTVPSQIVAMDEALDHLGDGQFQMGEYHYTLAVLGDSIDEVGAKAAQAIGAVAEVSAIQFVPVDLVSDAAWFAQQPGNFKWRPRKAAISSRAFAALACNHNFLRGKRDGNPWGEALMMTDTPSGQRFYLNVHASDPDEESEGKPLPGNTIILGSTGSGKTTLLSAMLALTPKWRVRPRIVSFSLDRDTEIIIRAMRGNFYSFERNIPTGINPLQRQVTPARISHWIALVTQCFVGDGLPLLPSDRDAIAKAVHTVAAMSDPALRWFSTVKQSLPRTGENSLYNRFSRWCKGGENGWVFDMAPDQLGSIDTLQAVGFDYTGVVANPEVKTLIMMELLDIMRGLIDGTPMIYHVAEAWKALGDPIFAPFIKNEQKTIRKKNGLGIFDTQEVSDLLANENGRTMVEQSVTKLILPNRDATEESYIGGLRLTQREFELTLQFGRTGARNFLCKQAFGTVQCSFDLAGADDMLTVLSATPENVDLLDTLRHQVGDDPDHWLPLLYQGVRNRRAANSMRKAA